MHKIQEFLYSLGFISLCTWATFCLGLQFRVCIQYDEHFGPYSQRYEIKPNQRYPYWNRSCWYLTPSRIHSFYCAHVPYGWKIEVTGRKVFLFLGSISVFHTNFTIMIHTVSIWLTLCLAIWRWIMIKFPSFSLEICTLTASKIVLALGFGSYNFKPSLEENRRERF